VLLTVYFVVFGGVNCLQSGPAGRDRREFMRECVTIDDKTLFVHLLVISVLFMKCNPIEILQWPININTDIQSISDFHNDSMVIWILDWVMGLVEITFFYRYTAVQAGTAEVSRLQKQRSTQSTAHSRSTIKCNLSVTITKKLSLKLTQQGRNT
jgi:hypothetical protein